MAIITLTTDLGLKDYYLSTVKGAILSDCPDAIIVDISHDINKYDILQASFVVKNSYKSFPKGSIHIIGITPEPEYLIFPTKDIFVKAACHIARGGELSVIGKKRDTFFEKTHFRAVIDERVIKGSVIYVDSYQNAITNITESMFREVRKSRNFTIDFKQSDYNINRI